MDNNAVLASFGVKPVKCKSKNPSTCRFHGKKYHEQKNMVSRYFSQKREEEKRQKKTREMTIKIANDLEKNLKLRTLPDGTTVCSVFRSGIPSAPTQRGVEAPSYLLCDKVVPEGRQGRTTAIFASPTMGGVNRWVVGNSFLKTNDIKVRELTIDIDNTYVYSVISWERASSAIPDNSDNLNTKAEELSKNYWASGITMREWLEKVKTDPLKYDPTEWELLIPESGIRQVKPVSAQRVATYNYSEYESDKKEVLGLLK